MTSKLKTLGGCSSHLLQGRGHALGQAAQLVLHLWNYANIT